MSYNDQEGRRRSERNNPTREIDPFAILDHPDLNPIIQDTASNDTNNNNTTNDDDSAITEVYRQPDPPRGDDLIDLNTYTGNDLTNTHSDADQSLSNTSFNLGQRTPSYHSYDDLSCNRSTNDTRGADTNIIDLQQQIQQLKEQLNNNQLDNSY